MKGLLIFQETVAFSSLQLLVKVQGFRYSLDLNLNPGTESHHPVVFPQSHHLLRT